MSITNTFLRFCSVGAINTLVDVALFMGLRSGGFDILPANIVSTSVALALSYVLNKGYTFQTEGSFKSLATFLVITLCGLWVIQPFIMYVFGQILGGSLGIINHDLAVKLIAIGVTFIWNYVWYSRLVFTKAS